MEHNIIVTDLISWNIKYNSMGIWYAKYLSA